MRGAINDRRQLHLDYHDAAGEVTERVVWPLTLAYWESGWALGAWCELRQQFRNFSVDRVQDVRLSMTRFPDEAGKRVTDYFTQVHRD